MKQALEKIIETNVEVDKKLDPKPLHLRDLKAYANCTSCEGVGSDYGGGCDRGGTCNCE